MPKKGGKRVSEADEHDHGHDYDDFDFDLVGGWWWLIWYYCCHWFIYREDVWYKILFYYNDIISLTIFYVVTTIWLEKESNTFNSIDSIWCKGI